MADKKISQLTLTTPVAGDYLVFEEAASGLFRAVKIASPNGIASLDANSKVPLSELPASTVGAPSPNSLALLDGGGALQIYRTLAGVNQPLLMLGTTDVKSYLLVARTDGSLALWNSTDANNVLLLGPGPTDLLDGYGRRIVYSGSNANGSYVRFSDGTQICFQSYVLTGTSYTRSVQGITEYYQDNLWTYPAAFVAVPYTYISGVNYNNAIGWGTSTTTQQNFTIARFSPLDTSNPNNLLAVGRWY